MHLKNCFDFQNKRVSRSKSHCEMRERNSQQFFCPLKHNSLLRKNFVPLVTFFQHAKNKKNKNNKGSFRTIERSSRSKNCVCKSYSVVHTFLFLMGIYLFPTGHIFFLTGHIFSFHWAYIFFLLGIYFFPTGHIFFSHWAYIFFLLDIGSLLHRMQ